MDEFIGKKVKVVYMDEGRAKVVKGRVKDINDTFVVLVTRDNVDFAVGKNFIISMTELMEV